MSRAKLAVGLSDGRVLLLDGGGCVLGTVYMAAGIHSLAMQPVHGDGEGLCFLSLMMMMMMMMMIMMMMKAIHFQFHVCYVIFSIVEKIVVLRCICLLSYDRLPVLANIDIPTMLSDQHSLARRNIPDRRLLQRRHPGRHPRTHAAAHLDADTRPCGVGATL